MNVLTLIYSCWINYLNIDEESADDLVHVPDTSPILAGSIILILVRRVLVATSKCPDISSVLPDQLS